MKRLLLILAAFIMLFIFCGCHTTSDNTRKLKDVEFTVIDPEEAPEALTDAILKKRKQPFKLTYTTGDSLYIARGYGPQKTFGYHITVDAVYLTANGLFFATTLYGPHNSDVINRSTSYPFIIVKVKRTDGCVIFN